MNFGVVEIDGHQVIMDPLSAMYVRAQQLGDTRLMAILEHRSDVHDGGVCSCGTAVPWNPSSQPV